MSAHCPTILEIACPFRKPPWGETRITPRTINIRHAVEQDVDGVLSLWTLSGALPTVTDRVESLRSLLRVDPQALLVAELDGDLVGSVIAAWNGWRGSFYRLAVHPAHRRRGVATLLVREAERSLHERGASRFDAIVVSHEESAVRFWQALGYERQRDRTRFVLNA